MVQKGDSNLDMQQLEPQSMKEGFRMFKELDIRGTKRWRKAPPSECPYCGDTHIQGIEIIGAKTGPLFWECEDCKQKLLRYTKETTAKYLAKTSELWVDLEGLETICQEIPN